MNLNSGPCAGEQATPSPTLELTLLCNLSSLFDEAFGVIFWRERLVFPNMTMGIRSALIAPDSLIGYCKLLGGGEELLDEGLGS